MRRREKRGRERRSCDAGVVYISEIEKERGGGEIKGARERERVETG